MCDYNTSKLGTNLYSSVCFRLGCFFQGEIQCVTKNVEKAVKALKIFQENCYV